MPQLNSDKKKQIQILISKAKALELVVFDTLHNDGAAEHARYSSYRSMASRFNDIAIEAEEITGLRVRTFNIDKMANQMNTVWPFQKEVLENVLLEAKLLRASLESDSDFAEDETEGLADFIQAHLRDVIYEQPSNERVVQNALETLFIGRGYAKGTDYDREAGKVEFSGKEYIPDFCMQKYSLAIEVKLLKEPKAQSRIIEEISADITAYSKEYSNQLFIIYDLGCIQNATQFKSDIEKCDGVRVIIVKH